MISQLKLQAEHTDSIIPVKAIFSMSELDRAQTLWRLKT